MPRSPLSFLAILSLIGCKSEVAPRLNAVAPPDLGSSGWTAASDPESGVSITLPPGWRMGVARTLDASALMGGSADLGSAGAPASEMGAELMRQDAEMEKQALAKMRKEEGIVLHCTDGSKPTPAEEPTRIYVKKEPDAGYGTLATAAKAEEQAGHREMKSSIVDLPVGKVARLYTKGQNRIGDVECHVSYVFLDGPDAYVLRFASTNAPDAILGIEKDVAQSFRLSKPR